VTAFETKTFPWTWRVAPPCTGVVPTPTFEVTTRVVELRVVAFIFGTKIEPEVIAFDTKTFPMTCRFAPPMTGVVPIPTFEPTVRLVRFETAETFRDVVDTFVVPTEVVAYKFPRISSEAAGFATPTPTRPSVPNIDVRFAVTVLIEIVAKTFVAVTEFETNTLPWTARVALPRTGVVPIPTFETTVRVRRFETVEAFRAPVTTFVVVIAFVAYTFPRTWSVADGFVTPTPTRPVCPKIETTLRVVVFIEVVAKTFVAVTAFETTTFPLTYKEVLEALVVPIPIKPAVPNRVVTLRVWIFAVFTNMFENREATFPIEIVDAAFVSKSPEKVEYAPKTDRFWFRTVLPVVVVSPKLVIVGISSKSADFSKTC
jgi:hypothetical protein